MRCESTRRARANKSGPIYSISPEWRSHTGGGALCRIAGYGRAPAHEPQQARLPRKHMRATLQRARARGLSAWRPKNGGWSSRTRLGSGQRSSRVGEEGGKILPHLPFWFLMIMAVHVTGTLLP